MRARIAIFMPLLAAAIAACGGGRERRGYVVVVPQDGGPTEGRDSGREGGRDAEDRPIENDGGIRDSSEEVRDAGEGFPDAEESPDAEEFPDTGRPDNGIPDTGPPDTGRIDTGIPDVGWPDFGFPDSGRSDTGTLDSGTPDSGAPPQFQTTVSFVTGTLLVSMNLVPPVASDPLSFGAELQYDNVGPGSQTISVASASVQLLFFSTHTFAVGPAHVAAVGVTTRAVSKTPGSGSAISAPETYCDLPVIATLDLSNGQQISDFTVLNCIR
jgi:hypothetical protein